MIPTRVSGIAVQSWFQFMTRFGSIAVGGCEYSERDDPGNLQFDWLEVQLQLFRERGMQVCSPLRANVSCGLIMHHTGLDIGPCSPVAWKLLS